MKQKGTVKTKKEGTKKNGDKYYSYNVEGEWYNCFDLSINDQVEQGDDIEFEYTLNGKFRNMTALLSGSANDPHKPIPEVTNATIASIKDQAREILNEKDSVPMNTWSGRITSNKSPDKDLKILRMSVLKTATEIVNTMVATKPGMNMLDTVKNLAEDLEKWVLR